MMAHHPVVIIGSGLAGYSLAKEIRKLDKDIPLLVLTADDGHSYSKPLLSTGFSKNKHADALSMGDAEKVAKQLNLVVRPFTSVTRLAPDKHCVYIGDEPIEYSKLVLAWGAKVIKLPIPGSGQQRIFSINDLEDYRCFRAALEGAKKVLIMGAGLIGCEFANDLINGGFEVDLVAPSSMAFVPLLPEPAAMVVTKGLEQTGVRFHFNTVVEQVDTQEKGALVQLSNGSHLEVDLVLSAVGLRPRIQLAEAAGLQVGRGILVNSALETSAPDVYALGDCANVAGHTMMFVLPLMACARELAKTLTGQRAEVHYTAMPVVTKTPACPVVVIPPPVNAEGEWKFEHGTAQAEDSLHIKGLFTSAKGDLLGYVLTGDFVAEKQAMTRLMPALF